MVGMEGTRCGTVMTRIEAVGWNDTIIGGPVQISEGEV